MALCTVEDVTKILPESTLNLLTQGDLGLIDSAIEQAESKIKAAVTVRYPWPLSPFPELLGVLAAELSVCILYRAHSVIPDVWQTACKDVSSTLKDITSGKIKLPVEGEDPPPSAGFSSVSAPKRMAGPRGILKDYQYDY